MLGTKLEFDFIRTMNVVSSDTVLRDMLNKSFPNIEIHSIVNLWEGGKLPIGLLEFLNEVYVEIICKRISYFELYRSNISNIVINKPSKIIVGLAPIDNGFPVKKSKGVKSPKEYNKIMIDADIKLNGGVSTEFHKAMLALNEMKNLIARLNAKGNRQRYGNGLPYSDVECSEIITVVSIMRNRLSII